MTDVGMMINMKKVDLCSIFQVPCTAFSKAASPALVVISYSFLLLQLSSFLSDLKATLGNMQLMKVVDF